MSWITEFFKAGGGGDLIQGGASLYGYQKLIDDLNKTEGRIGGYNPETGAYEGGLGKVYKDVGGAGEFKPYSMTSDLGTSGMNAAGDMYSNLSGPQQAYSDRMRTGALGMYGQAGSNAFAGQAQTYFDRAAQDPAQREQDVYNRIREMQRPGEERQRTQMTSNLFGSGRGGMGSGEYGASPEEYGFNMARNEAMNQASFQAIGQAQQEMQNYQNMGSNLYGLGQQNQQLYGQLAGQMGQAQYDPYTPMGQMNQQGLMGGQLMNQSGQALAGLLSQLGIGGMTTDVNLSNVRGSAFTGLMQSIGDAASGGGLDSILEKIVS